MERTVLLTKSDVNKLFLTIQLQRSVTTTNFRTVLTRLPEQINNGLDIAVGVFAEDVEEGGRGG